LNILGVFSPWTDDLSISTRLYSAKSHTNSDGKLGLNTKAAIAENHLKESRKNPANTSLHIVFPVTQVNRHCNFGPILGPI